MEDTVVQDIVAHVRRARSPPQPHDTPAIINVTVNATTRDHAAHARLVDLAIELHRSSRLPPESVLCVATGDNAGAEFKRACALIWGPRIDAHPEPSKSNNQQGVVLVLVLERQCDAMSFKKRVVLSAQQSSSHFQQAAGGAGVIVVCFTPRALITSRNRDKNNSLLEKSIIIHEIHCWKQQQQKHHPPSLPTNSHNDNNNSPCYNSWVQGLAASSSLSSLHDRNNNSSNNNIIEERDNELALPAEASHPRDVVEMLGAVHHNNNNNNSASASYYYEDVLLLVKAVAEFYTSTTTHDCCCGQWQRDDDDAASAMQALSWMATCFFEKHFLRRSGDEDCDGIIIKTSNKKLRKPKLVRLDLLASYGGGSFFC